MRCQKIGLFLDAHFEFGKAYSAIGKMLFISVLRKDKIWVNFILFISTVSYFIV